uniref:aspartate/glutamate racemase family protein n=1 Tax=Halomonas sp. TaxID=1486246 RepID=UPI002630C1F1|nr:aspartate/glutamate racemase family protein [Halomonas sp.]
MKTIGLLGGMSWESTVSYYQALNRGVNRRLGGHHSAKILMFSVDFAEIEDLQREGNWAVAGDLLAQAAQRLQGAGAELLLIGTNTMHKVADQVASAIDIPLLHIADATADALLADDMQRVGLLGTRFTMEQAFYRERLEDRGLEVLVPEEDERECVHRIIYDELCQGVIEPGSRDAMLRIMDALAARGAEAMILGCTEIALLVSQQDTAMPLYDTAALHAECAVKHALD